MEDQERLPLHTFVTPAGGFRVQRSLGDGIFDHNWSLWLLSHLPTTCWSIGWTNRRSWSQFSHRNLPVQYPWTCHTYKRQDIDIPIVCRNACNHLCRPPFATNLMISWPSIFVKAVLPYWQIISVTLNHAEFGIFRFASSGWVVLYQYIWGNL